MADGKPEKKAVEENKEVSQKEPKDMKTSEILDAIHEANSDDGRYDELYDELMERAPYDYMIRERANDVDEKLDGMQHAIDKLKRHKHSDDGAPVVPL